MSPYEIEIMLWYYCRTVDHEDVSRNPPVWQPTIKGFVDSEMLTTDTPPHNTRDCCYFITDKGRAYVEHLCAVQMPVCKWV